MLLLTHVWSMMGSMPSTTVELCCKTLSGLLRSVGHCTPELSLSTFSVRQENGELLVCTGFFFFSQRPFFNNSKIYRIRSRARYIFVRTRTLGMQCWALSLVSSTPSRLLSPPPSALPAQSRFAAPSWLLLPPPPKKKSLGNNDFCFGT